MSAVLWELAEQAETQPGRLAAMLLPYARARGWDGPALAAALDCSLYALARILLAREPAASHWEEDIAAIARTWGADPGRLVSILGIAAHHAAELNAPRLAQSSAPGQQAAR
jgi:hypothetical protein